MAMNRGGFSKNLAPGYRKVIFESYKQRPMEGTKLVNMNTSKRAYEEDFQIAGFGTMLSKPEGGPFVYEDALSGEPKRYTWTTYAKGFRITEELMEDDLYNIFGGKMSKSLGRSARNNQEIVMHAPYNNGFNTAFNGFVAGEALFGSHTSIRGFVQNNSGAADLGLLALQAGIEHFVSLLDESGMPMLLNAKYLVHNPGDRWMARQLLKSDRLPGTNFNDVNSLKEESLSPIEDHYLIDPDAWFLIADEHDVNYFDRRPLKMSNTDDFDTGDAKFKCTRRNGSGFGDWRGVYGNAGS